jgi:ABC-type multidrug transport system fused ATPase/permease subunit
LYSDAEVLEVLEYIGMSDFLMNKVDGINFKIDPGGSNLSIGERQLVCIGRALVKQNIQFLLLDEATANIDAETGILGEKEEIIV